MPREYSRCVGVALATWLPVAAVLGALQAVGLLTGASAAAAVAAGLIVGMLIALAFAASLAGLRRMIEGMGASERLGEATAPSAPRRRRCRTYPLAGSDAAARDV